MRMLQVLMSIQALILVEEPYYNEPGYEEMRGTPEGDREVELYNKDVRQNTMRWAMAEQVMYP